MSKLLLLSFLSISASVGYVHYQHSIKIKDLDFIYEQLCNNHPGFYNEQDLEFKIILNHGYQEAKEEISRIYWWQDHVPVLQKYLKKFNDSHLRIYKEQVNLQNLGDDDTRSIFIRLLSEKVIMIYMPTFMPNFRQQEEFRVVVQQLSGMKDLECIVFDLRGNSGGNSQLGTQLLQLLFGKEWVDAQLYKLYKKQTVWWRASLDNSNHLHELVSHFSKNKELNKDLLQWLIKIDDGVEQAIENSQIFYIENEFEYKKPVHQTLNPIKAKIIVVIDKSNVSASLDFITELKALTEDITFIGHRTDADTVYMEVRLALLPSKKATLQHPIKMYYNRPRGNNESYGPDIVCPENEIKDEWVLNTTHSIIENLKF